MNFVDQFILEEDFPSFVLDDANFSDIGLGILLGNLGKVKKVSPNFCGNLQKNSKIDNFSKVVILGRVFQIIGECSIELPKKNSQFGTELIGIFIEGTQLLISMVDHLIYLKEYIQDIYCQAFYIVIDKLAFNDNIRKIPLASLSLRGEFNFNCSLFHFDYEELGYLENFTSITQDISLNLVKKGLKIVKSYNLPRNDVLAIVVYCEFQKLLEHLERNRDFSYTEDAKSLIFSYKEYFSEKQLERLYERLDKIGCRVAPEDYGQRLNKSIERRDVGRKQITQSNMNKQKFLNKVFKNKYNQTQHKPFYNEIKTAILNILEDLRINYKQHIDIRELREQFIPIIKMNDYAVYEILDKFSYYEQYYSTRSIAVWNHICDALEDIKDFKREYYRKIVFNAQYIKENQETYD